MGHQLEQNLAIRVCAFDLHLDGLQTSLQGRQLEYLRRVPGVFELLQQLLHRREGALGVFLGILQVGEPHLGIFKTEFRTFGQHLRHERARRMGVDGLDLVLIDDQLEFIENRDLVVGGHIQSSPGDWLS